MRVDTYGLVLYVQEPLRECFIFFFIVQWIGSCGLCFLSVWSLLVIPSSVLICFWVEGVFLKKKQWGDLDSHSFGLNVVSLENEMSVALGGKN